MIAPRARVRRRPASSQPTPSGCRRRVPPADLLASLSAPSRPLLEPAPPQALSAPQRAAAHEQQTSTAPRRTPVARSAREKGKEREVTRQKSCLTDITITRGSARRRERERESERERELAPSLRASTAERSAAQRRGRIRRRGP